MSGDDIAGAAVVGGEVDYSAPPCIAPDDGTPYWTPDSDPR
ncbi:MAG TPA: hypothetical protein VLZ05_24205 [Mycobacterium sp.]|nr:hypothetical protein [Mycobacterium sp.]HUH71704.1 hypothetical protein [Mycobacterium sp.]